jgi:hypothetical protein
MVMEMVYDTQNYWVYGCCLSSDIPKTRITDAVIEVSKTQRFLVFGILDNSYSTKPSNSESIYI